MREPLIIYRHFHGSGKPYCRIEEMAEPLYGDGGRRGLGPGVKITPLTADPVIRLNAGGRDLLRRWLDGKPVPASVDPAPVERSDDWDF